MKCKYCQAELEDGVTVCPACGKEQESTVAEEVAEAPVQETVEEPAVPEIKEGIKATPGKIALAIAAGVAVLALLVAMVVSGIDGDAFQSDEATIAPTSGMIETQPAETVPAGTIPPDGNPQDVTCKGSYYVTEDVLNASLDTVVAVVGDEELTVGELQIYYWESIYAFDSEYGAYASAFGLDFSRSLDTQLCEIGDVSMTWQQYFLDYALTVWHQHQSMALAGKDAGYELADAYQAEMDNIPVMLEANAKESGYEDVDSWLRDYIGPGCTAENFLTYMRTYYLGIGHLENLEQTTAFSAEEVEAFYAENETSYTESGITKDSGKYYDVRHILVKVKNASDSADTTYSEEDWETCKTAAQQILDDWKAGEATEDSFAALAMEKSEDDGSKYNGGLYDYLTVDTNFVPTFKEWYLDESRQVGDTGLVQSDYGYHIMYFVGSQDMWYAHAEADLISDKVSAAVPAAMEKYAMNVDYSAIVLGQTDLVNG